jgi:branched-chain amino acid transport system permease protein
MSVIAATLAIALIVRSVCAIIWGFDVLAMPTFIQDRPIDIGGVIVSSLYTVSLIVLVCLIAVLYLFFQYTKVGIAMQATAQNQFSSYLMGIGVGNIFSLTWAIAGMCCCIAGILLAPIGGVHIHMSAIGLKAFPAAILGGMTSLPGAIVGGIIIGVTESLSAYYAPLVKDSIAFFILLVVLFVRPEGIFGSHQIKKV